MHSEFLDINLNNETQELQEQNNTVWWFYLLSTKCKKSYLSVGFQLYTVTQPLEGAIILLTQAQKEWKTAA